MRLRNTIHSHFVLPLLRHAEYNGVQPDGILQHAGLSLRMINRPGFRFTQKQYTIILRQLWKESNDEFFGLSAQPVKFGTFSLFCELALKENDVKGALEKQAECFKLATEDIRWELVAAAPHALYKLSIASEPPGTQHILAEFMISMTHRFASWLAGENIPLTRVWLNFEKPEYHDEYKLLFNCPCLYGQSITALEFPAKCLSWPNVRTAAELLPLLKNSPAGILINPITDSSFVLKVRRILLAQGKNTLDIPTFEEVADALGMSQGTLRRRLKAECTSYQALKDHIRRDVAIELLSDPANSVFSVACAVGFSEASTFSRAFRSWTGLSPTAYRTQDS